MQRTCAIVLFIFFSVCQPVFSSSISLPAADAGRFKQTVETMDTYRGDTAVLDASRRELELLLKRHPRYAPAHREMARYIIMQGHIHSHKYRPGTLEAADAAIKRALDIDPKYAEAYILRGHLYRLMKRPVEAVAALEQAQKIGTNDPWLQNNWADLLIDEGRMEEAARRYRQVLDRQTTSNRARIVAMEGMINYYVAARNVGEADRIYQQRLAIDPGSAWPLGNYAQFLLCRKDDYENAILRSREALAIMNYGVGRFYLAASLYRKWAQFVIDGTPDKGTGYFAEAQQLYPDITGITDYVGDCLPLARIAKAQSMTRTAPAKTGSAAGERPRI